MTLRLNGSTSGYTEIDAPAVAGSNSIVLPTGNGSANQFLKNGSTAGSLGWSSMVEDSSGNVGIGISPSAKLHVNGTSNFIGDITLPSASGTNSIKAGTGDNATRTTYNVAFKGWWGIAFQDYSDTVNRVLDCRDGTFQSLVPGTSSFMREYVCRAWVNFNGTGVVAIRASGNVSSITDNGTGDYTVNFTTAMPDANYAAIGTTGPKGANSEALTVKSYVSAGSVRIETHAGGSAAGDCPNNNLAIFR